ncbi:hypothetical protein [Candidatus Mycoplasma haematominutum]|nr:hypothetical protein [Candidatus Mycoplasma haematominutum]
MWLALVTTVIFGSAVGLPLSFGSKSRVSASRSAPPNTTSIQVNKCAASDSSGWKVVQFGDNNAKEPCWSISSDQGGSTSQVGTEETHFSNLFSEKWNSSDSKWATSSAQGQNQWRTMCTTGGSNQFVLPSSSSGSQSENIEYIGLCTGTSGTSQWISIEKQQQGSSGKNLTIKACSGDTCWTPASTQGSESSVTIKNFQSPSSNGWQQVTFKARS